MNNRTTVVLISIMLMGTLMWLGGSSQNQRTSAVALQAAAECPAAKPCVCDSKPAAAASDPAPVYGKPVSAFTPYELYVVPDDRPMIPMSEADLDGKTLWWSLDAVHSMRQITFNSDKTLRDETGWYTQNNRLTSWRVENNLLKVLKQGGSYLTMRRVAPISPDASDLILVQQVDPNFATGTGKYAPEVARSAHPLCKSGWVHGSGKMCYRVAKRGADFCKKLDPESTSVVESEADIKIIQNVLRRQRRGSAAAQDSGKKVSLDVDTFQPYSATTDPDIAFICSLEKYVGTSPPATTESKKQGYTQALPVDSHELFPHALMNTREGLGDILEMEDFKTAIEIGVQTGAFSDKTLRAWKSVEKYYLIDPWETQDNYKDVANVGQSEQDKLMNYVKERFSMYDGRVIQVRKYSQNAVSMFEDGSIDYIFVDARHDYGAVLEDITLYWPKCRKGGIMAGHDYLYSAEAAQTGQKWQIQGDGSSHIGGPRMAAEHFAASVGRSLTITREMPTWNGVAFRSWLIRC
eukprot:TRINITY_DN2651_c0_g3_i1.p1 TRINITY_DN2651_c0_g3~~TRINITY_DN2651_c0_g3_i1.p1  ORF type:complete len:521 (+),score=82.58 TRINITY_DN2651_c0_g3_i1:76-1638(+)